MTRWLASFRSGRPLGHPSQPTDGRSSCLADPVVSSGTCKVHTGAQALGPWPVSVLPEPGLGNPPQACRLQSILCSHAARLVTTNTQNTRDGTAMSADKVKGGKGDFVCLSLAQGQPTVPAPSVPHSASPDPSFQGLFSSGLKCPFSSIGPTLEMTHPMRL